MGNIYYETAKAGYKFGKAHREVIVKHLKEFTDKMGPTQPTAKEQAEAEAKMQEKPTAAYGRKKQGEGGGQAIIE